MLNKYEIEKLDNLIRLGLISSYLKTALNNEGEEGNPSSCRNTERLTLVFPNGEKLSIDCFCSGCAEDTVLEIS